MELYVDGGKIVDENKKELTIAQARAAWYNGLVDDYNLTFKRLADLDFDFEKLQEFFKEMDSKRGKV